MGGQVDKNSQNGIKSWFSSEGTKLTYTPKITLSWGFSVKNNIMTANPIRVINPSLFHRNIINSIK
jgi:hypothetical protein